MSTENGTQVAKEILDVKSAAKILGCSVSHVSNILNGKVEGVPPIPHVRAGRLRLIRREALMRWFEDQEQTSQGCGPVIPLNGPESATPAPHKEKT